MAEITRGEIWLADLNPVRGHEQAGKRPCLVISADLFNQGASGLVVVLPVTSKDKGIPFHLKMVRSQKSIGGAVGSRLGNAPYKLGVLQARRTATQCLRHRTMQCLRHRTISVSVQDHQRP
ncbi:type II toxin-antitoxin system PemK/MazF family toxin [Microcystis flos-aquae]|uniref:type II toxin-antitoxin system PemK/MazF family toxin n=1 Tax=Microcystis flos-aquae TaxID=109615 RepID=UPI0030FE989A